MASKSIKTLGLFKKASILDKGVGALLPEAYKKFYKEWQLTQPTAVHYIPEEGKWRRDDVTGQVFPIQNIPLPVFYPKEQHEHIWGGEGVVQGFQKRNERQRRVPHFWVPVLKRSVVYSEVLDKYISVVVTDRTIKLVHANYGFDHYLLKTPACDLRSLLALTLKRKVLQELEKGCPTYADQPEKQQEISERYQKYLSAYTPEEIKWYGYSFNQACKMLQEQMDAENKIIPFKHIYRSQLIEKLNVAKIEAASGNAVADIESAGTTSWLQKLNPFGKKHET